MAMADAARPHRAGLTVDKITAAALDIVRRVGVDGLTMRLLADELGVNVAATYRHVADKQALLELILDRALANVEIPPGTTGSPLERLAMITRQTFHEVLSHPGLDSIVLRLTRHTPQTRRLRAASIGLLLAAGFDPMTAKQVEEVRHRLWLGSVAVATVASERLAAEGANTRRRADQRARSAAELDFAIGLLDAGMRAALAPKRS